MRMLCFGLLCLLAASAQAFELANRASCFIVHDLDFRFNPPAPDSARMVYWQAKVTNRCASNLRVPVAAGFFDRQGRLLRTDVSFVDVAANGQAVVRGRVPMQWGRGRDLPRDFLSMEVAVSDELLQETRRALALGAMLLNAVRDVVGESGERSVRRP